MNHGKKIIYLLAIISSVSMLYSNDHKPLNYAQKCRNQAREKKESLGTNHATEITMSSCKKQNSLNSRLRRPKQSSEKKEYLATNHTIQITAPPSNKQKLQQTLEKQKCSTVNHHVSTIPLSYDNQEPLSYTQARSKRAREKKERLAANRAARDHRPWFRNRPPAKHRITHMLGGFAEDVVRINLGIFSWDSFKIFVTAAPFYVGARMIDEKLHNCFFDHKNKKNRNEPAQWSKEIARLSIGVPIALLGCQAFLSRNDDMQMTGQIFLTGMPFVLIAKDIIKKLDFDVCKRPYHEKFAKHQRSYGGFPSGHLAEATYTAVLYGMRFGPNFAVPLGSIAAFVTVIFLSSNRHYLSQMIAGAGFGAMYALSANKLIDSKLAKKRDLQMGLSRDDQGRPAMKLSMRF